MKNTNAQRTLMPCTFTDYVQVMLEFGTNVGKIMKTHFLKKKSILNF